MCQSHSCQSCVHFPRRLWRRSDKFFLFIKMKINLPPTILKRVLFTFLSSIMSLSAVKNLIVITGTDMQENALTERFPCYQLCALPALSRMIDGCAARTDVSPCIFSLSIFSFLFLSAHRGHTHRSTETTEPCPTKKKNLTFVGFNL